MGSLEDTVQLEVQVMDLSLALNIAAIAAAQSVEITAPVAPVALLVGIPTTVSGTRSSGSPVELTWALGAGSAGTVTYPSDFTWTCDVTPTLSDVAETGLVATVGAATSELSCSVAYLPEAYFQDATLLRLHDAARGATTGGGVITALAELVAGHADENMVNPASAPVYNAADASFGGTPSIESTGTESLRNVGNIALSQTFTLVWIAKPPAGAGTYYVVDAGSGAAAGQRTILQPSAVYAINAGSGANTNIAKDSSQAVLQWIVVNGASTAYRSRKYDGTVDAATVLADPGSNGLTGCTIMSSRTGSLAAAQKFRLLAAFSGSPTAEDIARFELGYWEAQLGASPLA